MKKSRNKFGESTLFEESDLTGKIYATSAACMSVWTDFLSWANANPERMAKRVEDADTIVVLGCQVTDLSILNDIRVALRLHRQTGKFIYMSGCLAQRFDIELPDFIKRLDVIRVPNQPLYDRTLVHYEPPFWVKGFEETGDLSMKEGNLFRNFYPLKIGAGCHGNCKYCTIKHTRGEGFAMDPKEQEQEFLDFENVVLICDSPTPSQIKGWCGIAEKHNKEISIRNIEPATLVVCEKEVLELSKKGLLKVLHCPVQSFDGDLLNVMKRNVASTLKAIEIIKETRKNGTLTATNIIIDYTDGGKTYPNHDVEKLNEAFDYYSWNPYFDGNFNIDKATERFDRYINTDK